MMSKPNCFRERPFHCQERPAPPPCPPQACGCDDCRCAPPPPPAPCRPAAPCCHGQRPLPSGGVLLPRIIAAGREWQRRCSLTLDVDGLPACAEGPLTLLEVTACGQPTWESDDCGDPRATWLHVHVPLSCLVRDCKGCYHTGRAAITADVRLRHSHSRSDCWRGQIMVLPCVRLICIPCASERPIFDVLLEVVVEAYMIRWEPCLAGPEPKPCCPDLPLFPQPCFP